MENKTMAKKPTTVETSLNEAVSAPFQCVPNDHAPEGAEALGGVVYKGVTDDEAAKTAFQAVVNGISGDIKPQFATAINDALQKSNVVPANYDRPAKWTDVHKTNKEPVPTSIDDLDPKDQKAFKAGYGALTKVLTADDAAMTKARDANFKLAAVVVSVREAFTSTASWTLFRKFAPDAQLIDFLGKNTINEFFKAGRIIAIDGFDAETMIADRVTGAKGVVSAYQAVLNGVANNVVQIIQSDKAVSLLKLKGDTDAMIRATLAHMISDNSYGVTEAGNQTEFDAAQQALADVMIAMHAENLASCAETFVTSVTDGSDAAYVVPREQGMKTPVVRAVMGLEGPDELLSAIVRALNAVPVAAVADDPAAEAAKTMAKTVTETKTPFADWPQDQAARHLANILFGRFQETDDDTQRLEEVADINGILERMGQWADAIFAENADIADLLDPEIELPSSVEDAEDEADAI